MKKLFIVLLLFVNHDLKSTYSVSKNEKYIYNKFTVKEAELKTDDVTLTIYRPVKSQTDNTPDITASGYKIDLRKPSEHKIIAVSRDLKRSGWDFGKRVKIDGAGKLDGIYTIQDLMNKRFTKRIDVLVDRKEKLVKLDNVQITLLDI